MKEVAIKGRYVNGVDLKQYTFVGTIMVDGKSFSGLVNDGRCPARITDGKVSRGKWKFVKRYEISKGIMNESLFSDMAICNIPEAYLSKSEVNEHGIIYHGRAIYPLKKENGVVVNGLYNAGIMKGEMEKKRQAFDDYVEKFSLSNIHPLSRGLPIVRILEGKDEPETAVGPWAMKVLTRDANLLKIGKEKDFDYDVLI